MNAVSPPPAPSDVFELRIYEAMPDRLEALHRRMGEQVLPVFRRHGVPRPVGNWECHLGPSSPLYIYMLRWADVDERMAAFERFYADPDWQAMAAEGPTITSMDVCFMTPSVAWPSGAKPVPKGIHELRFFNFSTADSAHGQCMLRDVELPHMERFGAVVLGTFQVLMGADTPRAAIFLAWDDFDQRARALAEWENAPALRERRAADYFRDGRSIVRDTTAYLMYPASYGMPTVGFENK